MVKKEMRSPERREYPLMPSRSVSYYLLWFVELIRSCVIVGSPEGQCQYYRHACAQDEEISL